jgi:molybdopterin converting factor small subunit
MRIIVKFTGVFSHSAGVDRDVVEVPEASTIERIIDTLSLKYTKLPFKDKKTYYFVNEKVADRDKVLKDGDQVMIFQMMAGG